MAKIYRVIQIKLNQFNKMFIGSPTYQESVLRRYQTGKHFSDVFTYKMAAKIDWQRYET